MREEEKLAHDVYVTLYQQWDLPVFDNISRAESQHMSMVLQALDARGLADPAAGKGLGEFMNADLQALYDELVAQGSESVVAALTAGATIEDLDISDLQASLKTVTDEDVRWVFETLLRGSENHMRAFVRNLDRYGETYEPQFIDSAYFDAIASGDMARGPQAGRGQGRQQGGAVAGSGRVRPVRVALTLDLPTWRQVAAGEPSLAASRTRIAGSHIGLRRVRAALC